MKSSNLEAASIDRFYLTYDPRLNLEIPDTADKYGI